MALGRRAGQQWAVWNVSKKSRQIVGDGLYPKQENRAPNLCPAQFDKKQSGINIQVGIYFKAVVQVLRCAT
jgi:hypothetical protein